MYPYTLSIMKHLKYISLCLFTLLANQLFAQTNPEITSKIVASQNYVFNANNAMPMSGTDVNRVLSNLPGGLGSSTINLSGAQYDVKVTKDSIVAYLPYYGRSYSAPVNPTDGGIKFTSKKFTYTESVNKKGVYYIRISTKDLTRENYQLVISISKNGYASLMVNSNNKQPINFNGYLSEPKKDQNVIF